ncbi:unnamed protein product [Notodromas monacha]|uniref:Mitochondrial Rho GTPase n=1 Tax=Notodromas monacha TaxID=399045 RepID=A0A7R9BGP0_9CRUS|nr:unnamed protein product [Notodromas monacha]CAG0914289.1 unnamed protein product [Notodromas monacha]
MVRDCADFRSTINILLVGDSGVGKTSLILTLVSEEFTKDVPARVEQIIIPPEVTPEYVATSITDYCAKEQSEDQLIQEIHRADVICIVYAVDDYSTLQSASDRWIPLLHMVLGNEHTTPVVLVGNKSDLVTDSTIDDVNDLMRAHREIETCVECSAKTLRNISELFYYAQKAVLHPTAPLYQVEERCLTEKAKKALTRVFKICDVDNDGLLNDVELNAFQKHCFNAPVSPSALEEVKETVKRQLPDGVHKNCLTLDGFLFLNCLFILRGKHQTIWTVLKKFGYNLRLGLGAEYLNPGLMIPPGASTELSPAGTQFLVALFERFDRDRDGSLCPSELNELFSLCPSNPWGSDVAWSVPTNDKGWITLPGFLAKWILTTYLDVRETMLYLAYLGYPINENNNQTQAVKVTREKHLDAQKKQTNRGVFLCHVIGQHGAGKSSFCQGLLKRNLSDIKSFGMLSRASSTTSLDKIGQFGDMAGGGSEAPKYIVNALSVYGQEKYLILRDIDVYNTSDALNPDEINCDVACLVYDTSDPKSFQFIAKIYIKYFSDKGIPCLLVGTKADLERAPQNYFLTPEDFCTKYNLPPLQTYSASRPHPISRDVFLKLATMASYPHLRTLDLSNLTFTSWLKLGFGAAAGIAIALGIMRYVHRSR